MGKDEEEEEEENLTLESFHSELIPWLLQSDSSTIGVLRSCRRVFVERSMNRDILAQRQAGSADGDEEMSASSTR